MMAAHRTRRLLLPLMARSMRTELHSIWRNYANCTTRVERSNHPPSIHVAPGHAAAKIVQIAREHQYAHRHGHARSRRNCRPRTRTTIAALD